MKLMSIAYFVTTYYNELGLVFKTVGVLYNTGAGAWLYTPLYTTLLDVNSAVGLDLCRVLPIN